MTRAQHRTLAILAATMLLAACGPEADMPMQTTVQTGTAITDSQTRVSVTRIGVFSDGLAYNSKRGVYVIRDNATGREFIGISGVGISEVGSHTQPAGKTQITRQDER